MAGLQVSWHSRCHVASAGVPACPLPNPQIERSHISHRSTMQEEGKQVETSPTLERKRAKYTVEDVRQLCGGISRSTVMREIRRKRLACYRARRTLRFSEEHITKYLETVEQTVK